MKLKTVNSQEKILDETLTPFIFPEKKQNLRSIIRVPGLLADVPGFYTKKIELKLQGDEDFKEIYNIYFTIKVIEKK